MNFGREGTIVEVVLSELEMVKSKEQVEGFDSGTEIFKREKEGTMDAGEVGN